MLPMIAKAGITLVGIDYKDRSEDAKAWLVELGNPYRTVSVDAQGRTGIEFGVYGVPESYLIDRQGIIRFKQTGPLTREIIENRLIPMAGNWRNEHLRAVDVDMDRLDTGCGIMDGGRVSLGYRASRNAFQSDT